MRIAADSNVERGPNSFGEQRDLSPEFIEQNLRLNGCPEHLITRAVARAVAKSAQTRSGKMGYSRKASVTVTPTADLSYKVGVLRKAARAMAQSLLEFAERDCPNCAGGGDDRYIREHVNLCAQFLEAGVATTETVEGILDNWQDEEDDSLRAKSPTYQSRRKKFRAMHRDFARMLEETCLNHAMTRLSADQIFD
jgi:hypothetical protein